MPGKVDSRDLIKLERALKLFAVRLPDAGEKVLEKTAEQNAGRSGSLVMSRPRARGKYKREPGAYSDVKRKGAHSIKIEAGGTAIGAEFGANFHTVFGKRVAAKSMKRRVFGGRVKRNTSGKVVGQTVKKDLPQAERRLAVAFDKAAEKEFRKAGL